MLKRILPWRKIVEQQVAEDAEKQKALAIESARIAAEQKAISDEAALHAAQVVKEAERQRALAAGSTGTEQNTAADIWASQAAQALEEAEEQKAQADAAARVAEENRIRAEKAAQEAERRKVLAAGAIATEEKFRADQAAQAAQQLAPQTPTQGEPPAPEGYHWKGEGRSRNLVPDTKIPTPPIPPSVIDAAVAAVKDRTQELVSSGLSLTAATNQATAEVANKFANKKYWIIGGVAGLGIIGTIIYFVMRKKTKRNPHYVTDSNLNILKSFRGHPIDTFRDAAKFHNDYKNAKHVFFDTPWGKPFKTGETISPIWARMFPPVLTKNPSAKGSFNMEIFVMHAGKPRVLQYHQKRMFDIMLKRVRQWEREGKDIHIIDVRPSVYVRR